MSKKTKPKTRAPGGQSIYLTLERIAQIDSLRDGRSRPVMLERIVAAGLAALKGEK